MKHSLAKDLAQISIFISLMIIFTLFVSVPFYLVPLTFQLFIAIMSGLLLGKIKGTLSMAIYAFMGVVCHLPIFSNFTCGFTAVLLPSFGYILSFILVSFVAGLIVEKSQTFFRCILASVISLFISYIIGITYFVLIYQLYIKGSNVLGAVITYNLLYIPKDLVLAILGAFIAYKLLPIIHKNKL